MYYLEKNDKKSDTKNVFEEIALFSGLFILFAFLFFCVKGSEKITKHNTW